MKKLLGTCFRAVRGAIVLTAALCAASDAGAKALHAEGSIIWKADFSSESAWKEKDDWRGSVKLNFGEKDETGAPALLVTGVATSSCSTAWRVRSNRIPYAGKVGKYGFSLKLSASKKYWKTVDGGSWVSSVKWFDAKGRQLARHRIPLQFSKKPGCAVLVDEVPPDSASFEIQLGMTAPAILKGNWLRLSEMKVSHQPDGALCRALPPDVRPPRVELADPEPTTDTSRPLRLVLDDPSGVDWPSVRVSVDGKDASPRFRREGDSLVLPRPPKPWTNGLHRITAEVSDLRGNFVKAEKFFLIGRAPETPRVSLREDGVLLVGGEPFFPIGIYGIQRREFNAYNLDRAVADLKAAGFNTLNSYRHSRDPEFLAAVRRHGLKMWTDARKLDADLIERIRFNPDVIAWYLGDDTFDNTTPEQLHDRDDYMKALDPSRPTCQADPVWSYSTVTRYCHYAAETDIFLPEIYPIRGKSEKDDRACVAQVIRDMRRIAADNRAFGAGRRHAVWPIIQMFSGYTLWKRMPREDELYGMSFASLIHGAKGITWYTYGGGVVPERKIFNFGVTSQAKVWQATTNVVQRISSLTPVLLSRNVPQPPAPEIVSGPALDALGDGPSVTVLEKAHDARTYLLAVNAADAEVTARFDVGAAGTVEVLWENRSLKPSADGTIEDRFAPLGVHVYRFKK
jgi:hypothetical protein